MPPRKRRDQGSKDTRKLVFERRSTDAAPVKRPHVHPACAASSPPPRAELAVHKPKIGEVRAWLSEALSGLPVAKYRRLLALTGPAGSGKSATIHALGAPSELNYDITEWHAESAFSDGADRISHAGRFEEFLRRAVRFTKLPFKNTTTPRRVVLVEDLPNVSHGETQAIVARALQHCVSAPGYAPHVAVVLIISDTAPAVDSVDSWRQRREASMDVRGVVPLSVRQHAAFAEIRFNPATPRMITGALERLAGGSVPRHMLSAIAETANGDIRGAANALSVASHDAPLGRENPLVLFHALGRILYNKRYGDPDDTEAPPPADEIPLGAWRPAPRRSRVDIEHLWASLPVDVDTLSLYLHHNYIPFTDTIDQCANILDALSTSDTIHGDPSSNLTCSMYSFHTTTRGVLLSLPSPVPRRAQRMTKPLAWDVTARRRAYEEALADHAYVPSDVPLAAVPLSEYACTVAPLLARLQGKPQRWDERPRLDGTEDECENDAGDENNRADDKGMRPEPPSDDVLDELEDLDA